MVTTLGLGTWQLTRYNWKVQLLEDRRAQLAEEPIDLTDSSKDAQCVRVRGPCRPARLAGSSLGHLCPCLCAPPASECPFPLRPPRPPPRRIDAAALGCRRVSVTGRFDYSREVHVTPRPPPKDAPPGAVPPTATGGYLAITPLVRPDGSALLVLRGWVPHAASGSAGGKGQAGAAEAFRPAPGLEGTVTVTGVLREPENVSCGVADGRGAGLYGGGGGGGRDSSPLHSASPPLARPTHTRSRACGV